MNGYVQVLELVPSKNMILEVARIYVDGGKAEWLKDTDDIQKLLSGIKSYFLDDAQFDMSNADHWDKIDQVLHGDYLWAVKREDIKSADELRTEWPLKA